MSRVYITGDCHADFSKFSVRNFPEQKELDKDDFVIICGDFGIWDNSSTEKYRLKWLNEKPFTTLFIDGNHENFDRLNSSEFKTIDYNGGQAQQIKDSIYRLKRGEIFNICGKTFFAFGGARSHDIQDGILDLDDFKSMNELIRVYNDLTRQGKMLRINHISWWEDEMPSEDEMKHGENTLNHAGNKVDFIITHCCPHHIESYFSRGLYEGDQLTKFFDKIDSSVRFQKWFFGHYHSDDLILDRYEMLYHNIVRVI